MLTQNTIDYSDRCLLIKDTKQNFRKQSLGMFIIRQTGIKTPPPKSPP